MFKSFTGLIILAGLFIPIQLSISRPTYEPIEFSYLVATQIPEEPLKSPVLATLIDDSAYLSINDLSLPVEPIIEEKPQEIQVSASFEQPPKERLCSCIDFIKNYYPSLKNKQLFYPTYLWRHFEDYGLEKTEPIVGALIIFKTDFYTGHIALITSRSETTGELIEKNQIYCKITTRSFDLNDSSIIGFLK